MVFGRKKIINNHEYYYLVHSTRIGENKWKKIERYVGINPPAKKDIIEIEAEFNNLSHFFETNNIKLEEIKKDYQKKIKNTTKDQLQRLEEEIMIKFTYDTNRIEGSTLTYKDTKMLLMEGISPKDKPMRDIKETENHKTAFLFMKNNISNKISKDLILEFHRVLKHNITEDAGLFRDGQVRVGTLIPIKPDMIETEINNLLEWYDENKDQLHPLELAGTFHCIFERIHPFFDGNGRVGRLLLNKILLQHNYPVIIIQNKNKRRYYTGLQRADDGNYLYMIKYVFSELENTLKQFYD
ncbi:Fic family protein [Candidatus Woesearchaeota archaeon]|nr:Fic family protein [Candidatus Woesearchaeota archaeon]